MAIVQVRMDEGEKAALVAVAGDMGVSKWVRQAVREAAAGRGNGGEQPGGRGPQDAQQIEGIAQRLAAIEAALAAPRVVSDGDAFSRRLAGVEQRLEALEAGASALKLIGARVEVPRRDPLAAVGPIRSAVHKRPKAVKGAVCRRCAAGCVPEICACVSCHRERREEF